MIYRDPPSLILQNFLCLDVGSKKTGIAYNFGYHSIAFPWKVVPTQEVASTLQGIQKEFKVIAGIPLEYPEGDSYQFIDKFIGVLQHYFPHCDFILWDETSSSDIVRKAYKHGRKGFSKKFHNNYDAKSASVILSHFLSCNF
ncbi:MAG: RNase H-fold protein (predicted Holliday junction resolvase) [Candidatus Deianiraeaceae bacterium]|jgi:RNase H-fold protein (predicted Holliday junction resolvase)